MAIKGVIFDLDGVIVSTDEYHYKAWKLLADEEGIYFDQEINKRLRGVSRLASLEIILERSKKIYSEARKVELTTRKNNYYKKLLADLSPQEILPGVRGLLGQLAELKIKTAIGSSSKNAPLILEKIGLQNCFDAVIDGNHIEYSKPHPQVFLLAAAALGLLPEECVVLEDATAGIEAALAANMVAVGVGADLDLTKAHYTVTDLTEIKLESLLLSGG